MASCSRCLRILPMRYRTLGRTGLTVSEIGFGTIPILRGNALVLPDYYNLSDEQAVAVMTHAFHLGCNLFDTAIVPEYGDAEIKLGLFAAKIGREKIIIADKSRFFTGAEMYDAVLTSCKNLDTYADIYFAHQVDEENADVTFGKGGAVEALCQLKAEGYIRFVGIASHYYDVLLRGANDSCVDVLQASGNLLERGMLDRMEVEPAFREKGLLLNKVYAAGILPKFFSVQELISGVLSYPISSALIGIGTSEEADAAMNRGLKDDPQRGAPNHRQRLAFHEVISRLEKDFSVIPCDRCQLCRCKYGTEIHILLRQYNYYFLGKDYWALRKLDLGVEKSAALCRTCLDMPCLKQCPRQINIPHCIEKIKELTSIHMRNSVI